jgi:hypothetical protein
MTLREYIRSMRLHTFVDGKMEALVLAVRRQALVECFDLYRMGAAEDIAGLIEHTCTLDIDAPEVSKEDK